MSASLYLACQQSTRPLTLASVRLPLELATTAQTSPTTSDRLLIIQTTRMPLFAIQACADMVETTEAP